MYKIIGADGKEYGPVAADVLRQWIAQGRASAQSRVLPEGTTEWKVLSELPEFADALTTPPSLPVLPESGLVPLVPKTNPLALTGMILGILSVTFGICCCYGLPFSVAGIVCSSIALNQINNAPQHYQGKGMAVAGLVLSVLDLGLAVLFFVLGLGLSLTDVLRKVQSP